METLYVEARRPVPSIGRIVHYHHGLYGTVAGVVVAVVTPHDPMSAVHLAIFLPRGKQIIDRRSNVEYNEDAGVVGCWSWPPYVPPVTTPGGVLPLNCEVVQHKDKQTGQPVVDLVQQLGGFPPVTSAIADPDAPAGKPKARRKSSKR